MGQDLISDPDAVAALERADALHTALTHIVLEGGDLGRIAEEVGHALHCGVVFTTTDGREQAAHLDQESRQSLVEADLIDPTGRLRVERTYDGAPVGTGEALGLRVGAAGVDLARLVAIGPSRIHPSDVHALERTAIVAALLITREQAVAAVENKYRGDFLRDVFLRRAGSDHYVAEHAQAFGWDLERPVVVVVAELDSDRVDGESVPGPQRRTLQDRFANAWRQVSSGIDRQIASVDFSSEVVTLLPVIGGPVSGGPVSGGPVSGGPVSDGPGVVATEALVRQAVEAVRGDRGGGRVSFSVGVSRLALGSAELPLAYQQARRAVEVGRRVRGSGSTTYFDQLGVHRLLALVPDPAELSAYVADVLGPLAERTPEAADLRATLQVLLDTNFNVAEAARAQFFHYNTMRYRVGKLQRLLGPVASDPHLRLDVAVALRALEIVG